MRERKIDYNGDESTHALPIVLEELKPGLPSPGLAGSVLATSLAAPHVCDWLENPDKFLLPKDQWPTSVPKASVQVTSDQDYYSIIQYLRELDIVEFIDYADIFEVDGTKVLNGLFPEG